MRTMILPRSAARVTVGAFSLLASAALLAACSGGADVPEPAAGAPEAPVAAEQPEQHEKDGAEQEGTEEQSDGDASKDANKDGSGSDRDQGTESAAPQDEAWPDPEHIDAALELWAGTASVDTLPSPDGLPFLVTQQLYDTTDGLSLDAAALQSTEYLGSHGAQCTGSVAVGGSPATCTFTGTEGQENAGKELTATVHLVRSGAGSHALLMAVGQGETTDLSVVGDTQMLLGHVDFGAEVTGEMIGAGLLDAAHLAGSSEGEGSGAGEATCKLHTDESHAVCQLSGLDEGTSGFWYATVQPGADHDGYQYLFTQFVE